MATEGFKILKENVGTDNRGRVTLGSMAQEKRYRVLVNESGQILLDPVISVSEQEMWLWQNKEAMAAIKQGIAQAAAGQVEDLGSFAEYADLEIEE